MAMTAERVMKILAQARAKSAELGLLTTTAVVDGNGLLQGLLRMEGARFTTVEISDSETAAARTHALSGRTHDLHLN